ncbi:DUF1015 domain-containing protein [Flavihumibacter sp. R14]|nr:DUF1015 domain-containing protein [Flavihumibacter soli]
MPRIKPFKGILPNSAYVNQIVLEVENLNLETAKVIREENPYSYVNMLVPKVDNKFLRGSKRELAYKKINENFEDFLEKEILIRDTVPSHYIYQIRHRGIVQTGIWTCTCIDDYLNNTVKKHELTRADRENALIDYLQQTGVDANPVLITYTQTESIRKVIERKLSEAPDLDFATPDAGHRLWKVSAEAEVMELNRAFADLPVSYIADGHHRAAAASLLGIERRKLNLKHTGKEEYNFFTSVYMATDQLQILEFNRLIKDTGHYFREQFLSQLTENFEVHVSDSEIKPAQLHEFGMYLDHTWYRLSALPHTYMKANPVADLDVTILQDYLLEPVLRINDPRTDPRIGFMGGVTPIDELVRIVDSGEYAVAFTLFPTSIDQLIRVADAGEVMPPKSTWFEPKFQAGLVIHKIS